MLFNTIEFALFLPVVFAVYWLLGRRTSLSNLWIIAASYFFYGMWDWRYLLLILFTTISTYASGVVMESESRMRRRAALWMNILVNVAILGTFKYFNFFADSFASLLEMLGMTPDRVTLDFALPVGISFYTIQAIGYSIDVYKRRIPVCRSWIAFFAFLSFFPQLVAGPIERAANLLPQFQRRRRFDYAEAVDGCRRILWGLFKKVVVADSCAAAVDLVYESYTTMGTLGLFIGAILFSFQIYGDFSGYSDIAIGVGRLFGISLMENFRLPFFSRSIKDFWNRWHISLTGWFRDYVYIPMGGNRCGTLRRAWNTMAVFLLSGLWHGASWTYVAWGGFHGTLLMKNVVTGRREPRYVNEPIEPGRLFPRVKVALAMMLTGILVALGLVIFRSPSITVAAQYFVRMVTAPTVFSPIFGVHALGWCLLLIVIEWLQRNRTHVFDIDNVRPTFVRYLIYWVMMALIYFHSTSDITFIYFQF